MKQSYLFIWGSAEIIHRTHQSMCIKESQENHFHFCLLHIDYCSIINNCIESIVQFVFFFKSCLSGKESDFLRGFYVFFKYINFDKSISFVEKFLHSKYSHGFVKIYWFFPSTKNLYNFTPYPFDSMHCHRLIFNDALKEESGMNKTIPFVYHHHKIWKPMWHAWLHHLEERK